MQFSSGVKKSSAGKETEKGTGKAMRGGRGREKRRKIDSMKSARNGRGDGGAHGGSRRFKGTPPS